jgi:hypothetical protein
MRNGMRKDEGMRRDDRRTGRKKGDEELEVEMNEEVKNEE